MSGSTSTSAQRRLIAAIHLPQWVNQLADAQNQLSDDDIRRIEVAKQYAAKITEKLMKEEAEKNAAAVAQQTTEASSIPVTSTVSVVRIYGMTEAQLNTRLYVGSLHPGITEQHIRLAFSPFGPLKFISLTIDPITLAHKGFCFVDFDTAEGASMALDKMSGVVLAGRPLKIGRPQGYTDEFIKNNPPSKTRLFITNIHEIVTEDDLRDIFSGFGIIKAVAMPPDPLNSGKHKGYAYIEFDKPQAVGNAISCMDEFLVGDRCIKVSGCTLGGKMPEGMPSTGRGKTSNVIPSHLQSIAESISKQLESRLDGEGNPKDAAESSSKFIVVLTNMVDAAAARTDPLLEQEVREECEKFGAVTKVQINISPQTDGVDILVGFQDLVSAQKAVEQLNGRWFGGRQISASFSSLS